MIKKISTKESTKHQPRKIQWYKWQKTKTLGVDVFILFARQQKDIKGFESNILVVREIRRDQRQEDQLEDYCNKIIRAEIKAEVEIEKRFMRHYQFDKIF